MASKRASLTGGSGGSNPLQSDGELQNLMSELDTINDPNEFKRWRSTFVDRLEEYLGDPDGVTKAREADAACQKKMPKVDTAINKMDACIDEGTNQLKMGVKAQMGLSKLKEACQDMEKRLDKLLPSTGTEAAAVGYTKWNLGAVLVKDGFLIYQDMMHHDTALKALSKILEEAQVDKQVIDIVQYYITRIHTCLDILADLGLMKVMEKTQQFVPSNKQRPPSKLVPETAATAPTPTPTPVAASAAPAPSASASASPPQASTSEAKEEAATAKDDVSQPTEPASEAAPPPKEAQPEPTVATEEEAAPSPSPSPSPSTSPSGANEESQAVAEAKASESESESEPAPEEVPTPEAPAKEKEKEKAPPPRPTTPTEAEEGTSTGKKATKKDDKQQKPPSATTASTTTSSRSSSTTTTADEAQEQAPPEAAGELVVAPAPTTATKASSPATAATTEPTKESAKQESAPAATAPAPAPPKQESKAATDIIKQKERRQTITITTSNQTAAGGPGGRRSTIAGGAAGKKKGVRKSKSFDGGPDPDDLPRTVKPKAKAILPGEGGGPGKGKLGGGGPRGGASSNVRGRGVGRTLSKEEAKEVKMANPYDKQQPKRKTAPRRSKTDPNLPSKLNNNNPPKGKEDEEEAAPQPPPDDGDPKDQNDDQGKHDPPKGKKKQQANQKEDDATTKKKDKKGKGWFGFGKSKKNKTDEEEKQPDTPAAANGNNKKPDSTPKKGSAEAKTTNGGTTSKAPAPAPPKQKQQTNKVPIVVYYKDRKIQLMVDVTKDTIGDIKKLLQPKTLLAIDKQRISGKWSGLVYEADDKALKFFGIKQDTELDLDPMTLQIQAKIVPQNDKVVTFDDVSPGDTGNNLKDKIAKETGLSPPEQELYFKDKELTPKDLKHTVKMLGMQEGSMITVELFSKVPISIKPTMIGDDAKPIELMVSLKKDCLADIKQSVEKETGVPVDNQALFLMPTTTAELVEKKKKAKAPLKDYGIQENSQLILEPKILRISVEMPNGGKATKLKVTPVSDMSEIIRALVKTGMAKKSGKHVLKFRGMEFPMGKTVKDMGLQDGSNVKLDLSDD